MRYTNEGLFMVTKGTEITKKDAFSVTTTGIPEALKDAVTIENGQVVFHNIDTDGNFVVGHCAMDRILAYEPTTKTPSGWNCWVLGEDYVESRIILKNNEYWVKPASNLAAVVVSGDILPNFCKGMDITSTPKGYSFDPGWGDGTILTAEPEKGIWIFYGTKKDGSPDVNYCQFGTKSSAAYNIIDGEVLVPLDSLA